MMKTLLVMSGLVLALSLGACRQKEGEACQTNSDCKSGLVCCFDSSSGKGICQTECVVILDSGVDAQQDSTVNGDATTDASVLVDSSVVDGQVTDSSIVDAAVDAMIEDAASSDASVQDDATLQDAATTDASVDAN